MFKHVFILRMALLALIVGFGYSVINALHAASPFADIFIPLGTAVVLLLAIPIVLPGVRSFIRSGAGLFAWLAASAFLLLVLPHTVFAQDGGTVPVVPGFDLTAILGSVGALAAFLAVVMQFIRAHVWKTADGKLFIAATFIVGMLISAVGFYLQALPPDVTTLYAALAFGFSAALTAVGGVNLLAKKFTAQPVKTITESGDIG